MSMEMTPSNVDWEAVFDFASGSLPKDPNLQTDSQVPTPPSSVEDMPMMSEEEPCQLVSVSSTFFPTAQILSLPPDLVVMSSDQVYFYVHRNMLNGISKNAFRSLLSRPSSPSQELSSQQSPSSQPLNMTVAQISAAESSSVLNIILHAIYDLSCTHFSPSLADLVQAVDALPSFGITPSQLITPSSHLFSHLLSLAPLYAIDIYALGAHHFIHELAVSASSHLLAFSLPSLDDEMAERMGAIYVKKLFFLHFGRTDALRRVLLPPPHPHPPTQGCDFTEQKKLTRAWALASAYLAWDARPDMSTSSMESTLRPLGDQLTCDLCAKSLADRIKNLVVQWSVVRRTI